MSNESNLISKVWNFANILRDDGVSYGDYLEQITYLLFLKMADEMSKPPYSKKIKFPRIKDSENNEIPDGELCNWETLTNNKRGAELESYYSQMLRSLATEKGTLGQIFTKSQNKIQDPSKLLKIIDMLCLEEGDGVVYQNVVEMMATLLHIGGQSEMAQGNYRECQDMLGRARDVLEEIFPDGHVMAVKNMSTWWSSMAGFRSSLTNAEVGMSQKAIIPSTNSERWPCVLGPVRR